MKINKVKSIIVLLIIVLAFFLGGKSIGINFNHEGKTQPAALFDSTTVYRCGSSRIYHPTTLHGSFKVCKTKVYELTVEQARKLGMRHCRCSG